MTAHLSPDRPVYLFGASWCRGQPADGRNFIDRWADLRNDDIGFRVLP